MQCKKFLWIKRSKIWILIVFLVEDSRFIRVDERQSSRSDPTFVDRNLGEVSKIVKAEAVVMFEGLDEAIADFRS